jgi:hypothetical protein
MLQSENHVDLHRVLNGLPQSTWLLPEEYQPALNQQLSQGKPGVLPGKGERPSCAPFRAEHVSPPSGDGPGATTLGGADWNTFDDIGTIGCREARESWIINASA